MVSGYVEDLRVGFVTDLWSPPRDPLGERLNPGQAAVVAAVKKAGIAPELSAGGHGGTGKYADLAALDGKSLRGNAEAGSQARALRGSAN